MEKLKNIKFFITEKLSPFVIIVILVAINVLLVIYNLSQPSTIVEGAQSTFDPIFFTELQAQEEAAEFLKQMAAATDKYGRIDESSLNDSMRKLVKNNTLWQQAYRLYRQNVWDHYEGNRLRDGVPCEGYDVTCSDLFTGIK